MSEENTQLGDTAEVKLTTAVEAVKVEETPSFDTKKWLYMFEMETPSKEKKKFFILKPNRTLKQSGDIEYAKQLAVFVKAGLLPKAAWNTILENLGGTISDKDAQDYNSAKRDFFTFSIELNTLEQNPSPTEEQSARIVELKEDIEQTKTNIQTFELEQMYIFENTAEAKARNATIQWWLSQLSYSSETEQFFVGKTFDEKMDWYDGLDPDKEDEAFKLRVGQRFNYFITMWALNRIASWLDFKDVDVLSDKIE